MIKIFVDTGSSIKHEEKSNYDIELIPLLYRMGEEEYQDGIDLTIDEFYNKLIGEKLFPKTSLPELEKLKEQVTKCTDQGDDVIIITISSKISGTNNAIKLMFEDNDKVHVIDSMLAVGGMRLIVEEINKYRDQSIQTILEKVDALIPRIRVLAIPETLDYLFKGGRLSKLEWLVGSLLNIKPIITFVDGNVKVDAKKIGLANSMKYIAGELNREADPRYHIIPSYTYKDNNLKKLIALTDKSLYRSMTEFDNLDPVIACHWGPNAFGFIYVKKEN